MQNNLPLNIKTILSKNGGHVSFCPKRGGVITSLVLKGKEILYLDSETFIDMDKKVRGGIPILFPNAGALQSDMFPLLQQHGFARNSSQWTSEETENSFTETLEADEESKKIFPYDFFLQVMGMFEADGSFTLTQEAKNTDQKQDMPIAMGLHPYFRVASEEKKNIRFNFEGGKYIEEHHSLWSEGTFISIDNPKITDPRAVMNIVIPDMGTITLDPSSEFKKIWIWSLPNADFVCIEPVMGDIGKLNDDPEMIKPGDVFKLFINFNLK